VIDCRNPQECNHQPHSAILNPINTGQRINTTLNFNFSISTLLVDVALLLLFLDPEIVPACSGSTSWSGWITTAGVGEDGGGVVIAAAASGAPCEGVGFGVVGASVDVMVVSGSTSVMTGVYRLALLVVDGMCSVDVALALTCSFSLSFSAVENVAVELYSMSRMEKSAV